MFSFFSKKNYLVDHLGGFVDIHNHILPGIDDGAKTVEESIDLIKAFGAFGVKKFICTPHIMHNYYDNTPKTIKKSFKKLKNILDEKQITDVSIGYAAEHMIDDNFEQILEHDNVLPINNNYLLIEMSYLQSPINFDVAIQKVKSKGFFPILAHPERYFFLHNQWSKYLLYKESGLKFQMNLLSLGQYYGKETNNIALKLLEKNLIDHIATDVHHMQNMKALKSIVLPKKIVDKLEPIINNTIEIFY